MFDAGVIWPADSDICHGGMSSYEWLISRNQTPRAGLPDSRGCINTVGWYDLLDRRLSHLLVSSELLVFLDGSPDTSLPLLLSFTWFSSRISNCTAACTAAAFVKFTNSFFRMPHAYDHDHIHHLEVYWCDTAFWIKCSNHSALFEVPVPGDIRLSSHPYQ